MVSFRNRKPVASPPEVVGGVDLGSNSFHLVVARAEEDGRIHVLDRLRAPVRLAAGLDAEDVLSDEAVQRGVAALAQFGERLRDMPARAVRAVSTNTLRRARNGLEVEEAFSEALGHPVETISGREEARLIYSGVTHTVPDSPGRLLVLDIGGGSTECIIGRGYEPLVLDSLYMGCVGYTRDFFGDGKLSAEAFQRARLAAGLELASLLERYRQIGWDSAVGSSGTILAVREVLRAKGWGDVAITAQALEKLERELVSQKRISQLTLEGLEADRAPVFAGGVAILSAAFQFLGIESMSPAAGALREGIVYELLERDAQGDPRDRSVETLSKRYKVDRSHAARVAATAATLFEQANESWEHDEETALRLLEQAATLHEIGLSIAYTGHQRHGAYILEHADMPGFSMDEQQMLATIVGSHRRKLTQRVFEALPRHNRELAFHLTLVLRLAVRLHHSRSVEELPPLRLRARKARLLLSAPPGWLEERPLTAADLAEEATLLDRVGVALKIGS